MERLRLAGFVRRPTADEIRELAAAEYMNLNAREIEDLEVVIDHYLKFMDRLDDLPRPELEVRYTERDKGRRLTPEEDPHNVFIRKCLVKGATDGKLAGKTVGLKDNICVAHVPMTNGSNLIPNYVPDIDATVVERLLDEGATIVGKLNMDDFAFYGTSETSHFGCVRNPSNLEFSAGGSSGGSGAAVALGAVDIALAVDNGGSGRIPASWCGVACIKATHGLVPTFGVTYLDHITDYVCPTAKTVADVALTLEVIAGHDPKDAQWVRGPIKVDKYTEALRADIVGLKVGIVTESLLPDALEDDVGESFWAAIETLRAAGASCEEVSFPLWSEATAIWNGFAAHSVSAMVESDLEGFGRGGFCNLGWQEAFGNARRTGSDGLPPVLKVLMIVGKYLRREYKSTYFSKAINLRYGMKLELDALLAEADVLVTPTMPMKAPRLVDHPMGIREVVERAEYMGLNTYPTNVTGHPSLTVPCGIGENDLPIGLQLVGKHFDESLLFRVGHTFESAHGESAHG